MQKVNFNDKDIPELFRKAFLKVFDNEAGEFILAYFTFKFQENLRADINNINNTYLKLGKAEFVAYLKNLLNNYRSEKNEKGNVIEY